MSLFLRITLRLLNETFTRISNHTDMKKDNSVLNKMDNYFESYGCEDGRT